MQFRDRNEAAELLLKKLQHYRGSHPLVLGIPRGAIIMANIIAEGLEGELGLVLVHKIPAPGNEEFAVASVGLSGHIDRQPYIQRLGIPDSYIESEAKRQLAILQARSQRYGLKTPNYQNRTVIIVDDGIATGATMISAIHEVEYQKPKEIIVAAAVSASDSAEKISNLVDDVVVLNAPDDFFAVGQFYQSFPQISDEEVIAILEAQKNK